MKLKNLMGGDWFEEMKTFLSSAYFKVIETRLAEMLKIEDSVLVPSLDYIFRPLKLCAYDNLKVVILNDFPMKDLLANDGLAFSVSNPIASQFREAEHFYQGVEKEMYDGFNLDINFDLKKLANQGVLLLNASPTLLYSKTEDTWTDHKDLWRPFMSFLITKIVKQKTGVVFILCGKEVRHFAKIILPTQNYLLTCTHPREATHFAMTWDSGGVFDITNQILKQNSNEIIIW